MSQEHNVEEIRGALARGYCAEGNTHKILDNDLIEAMGVEVEKYIASLHHSHTEEAIVTQSPKDLLVPNHHIKDIGYGEDGELEYVIVDIPKYFCRTTVKTEIEQAIKTERDRISKELRNWEKAIPESLMNDLKYTLTPNTQQ